MNEQLKIIISAEINDLKNATKSAKEQIKELTAAAKKGEADFSEDFKKMGASAKAGLQAAGKAIAAASATITGLMVSTSEYRTEQAKLDTAFKAAGSSAEVAKETYNGLYRVIGDSGVAVEAANHLAKLTTNEKDLAEWTNICQGVYATFGDSLPIEGLTEAVNHTAKLGEVQGPLADALEWSGISAEAFNEKLAATNSEAEREKLIRETLTGMYSEAAAGYEKNAASLIANNEAQAKFMESLANIATALQPFITMITELGAQLLTMLLPAVQQISEFLQSTFEFVKEYPGVLAAIATAIGIVVAGIALYNTHMAIKKMLDAGELPMIVASTTAYLAKAAAMVVAVAPYVLMVAAIAAVVAAIVWSIKNWDKVKETVVKVWDIMVEKVSKGVEAVVNFFTNMGDSISSKASEIKSGITEKFQSAKDVMSNAVSAAKSTVVSKFNEIKSNVSSAIGNVYSSIKSKMDAAKNSVSSILGNIKSKFDSIFNSVKTTVSNAIERIKSVMNFEWSLPKLKLPHVNISGSFSLMPPSVPRFSIDWYAKGGIFDSPTLFGYGNGLLGGLGENGAEAIVPLEKNTQWLDRIAERLQEGKNIPIVLNVDGKTFAQTSIKTINDLTRQTGTLALNII